MIETHQGGCLCGAIRFSANGPGQFPHLCSCRQCQRWSGAPAVGWVDFRAVDITWIGAKPTLHRSSPGTQRGFCSTCGSTVCAIDDGADTICFTTGSFDDPSHFEPESHSFSDAAPGWFETDPR